jgi:hypothetical protein
MHFLFWPFVLDQTFRQRRNNKDIVSQEYGLFPFRSLHCTAQQQQSESDKDDDGDIFERWQFPTNYFSNEEKVVAINIYN